MDDKRKKSGADHPLEDFEDDCLDRGDFAKKVFKIIEGTPHEVHLRVGVDGDWGSGKTTVLNYIKTLCQQKNYPVATFNPWHFKTQEEAWMGFALSIDAGLNESEGARWGTVKRYIFIKGLSEKVQEAAKLCNSELGGLLSQLVLEPLTGYLDQNKKRVQKLLQDKLGTDRRLYVFIDDLDRANPDILYQLLMFLNEVVDLNQCVFVIAYDSKIAAKIIENKTGIESGKDYLEKIINWNFDLPSPTKFDWKNLIEKELQNLDKGIKKEYLDSLFDCLPKNPRKLKHYLQYLSGLHRAFLSRLSDEELKWDLVYLGQLFNLEFPGEFNEIIKNEELMKEFSCSAFRNSGMGEKKDQEESPSEKKFVEPIRERVPQEKKNRFDELLSNLKNLCSLLLGEEANKNFKVIDNPDSLTWKEYHQHKESILSAPGNKKVEELQKILNRHRNEKEVSRARDFLRMLLEDRRNNISYIVKDHDQEKMKTDLDENEKLIEVCNLALDLPGLFDGENPVFNENVFSYWYALVGEYANFNTGIYETKFDNEKSLFLKLAEKLKVSQVSKILRTLKGTLPSIAGETISISEQGFAPIRTEFTRKLDPKLLQNIFSRFEKPGAVKLDLKYRPEQEFIFNKDSLFHEDTDYKKLRCLAEKAKNSRVIWENFYEFWEIHRAAVTRGLGWMPSEKAQEIVKIKKYITIIWETVISRKINRRDVGSLEEHRTKIETVLGVKLPVPEWWKDMLNE